MAGDASPSASRRWVRPARSDGPLGVSERYDSSSSIRRITIVTVYSKPSCVQCTATYRALDDRGIPYEVKDLSADPQALEQVKSLGHLQAPVVVTPTTNWSGFRPDLIATL